jgi:putative phage-type endonuclease
MIQGSPEWHSARMGRVTASRVADVLAKTKSGWGSSRANYEAELIAERLTGITQERYTNSAMAWGTETEPQARAAYEFYSDLSVEECGFIIHPKIKMAGASPDGLIGDDGLVEIKCPNTATHIDTLLNVTVPHKYVVQMLFQMACAGRSWCDFVSYDPRMPEDMRIFIKRIEADQRVIGVMEQEIETFIQDLDAKITTLRGLCHG